MLIKHVATLAVINEDVSTETRLQNLLCREEGAPAGDHIFAIAVMFNVRYDTLGKH